MHERQALNVFSALSQGTRLQVVRLLVKAGPLGMAAGMIADEVGAGASAISFHLKGLEHAGLVSSRREARSIIYAANYETLSNIIQFLMRDCCGGQPEICNPAVGNACTPAKSPGRKTTKAKKALQPS